MSRLSSIQYCRALAAVSVVVFHIQASWQSRVLIGAAGVDMFFVISGFIMGYLMCAEAVSPKAFIGRRLARIVPLYWICTLAALIGERMRPGLFYKFDPSMNNLIPSLLFIPHVAATPEGSPTLIQGWTLEYEMFFYLACTLCLLLPVIKKIPALIILLLGLAALGSWLHPAQRILATYTSPLLTEFAAGLGLALLWRARGLPRFASAGWILAGLGFAVLAGEAMEVVPITGNRVLDWGVPAFMIVAGGLIVEQAGRLPFWRGGLILGDASYALYLTHAFVIAGFLSNHGAAPPAVRLLVCTALAIMLAVAINRLLEIPLHDWLRAAWPPRRAVQRT